MSHALWWRCTCSPETLQLLDTSMHSIQLNEQVGWLTNYSTGLSAGGQSPVSFIWEEEAVVGTLFRHHCFRLSLDQGKVSLFRILRPKVLGYDVHNTIHSGLHALTMVFILRHLLSALLSDSKCRKQY